MKRRTIGWLVALVVVLGGGLGGGWWAAGQLQSPAQRDAAASPPAPKPVTVPVTKGSLVDTTSAQTDVAPAGQQTVALASPGDPAVVTAQFAKPGSQVGPGSPLVAINDQPVFVLPGSFALYRDLVQGDKGADVSQVQAGLRAAGYTIPTSESGRFGWYTGKALRSLYKTIGATAPTTQQQPDAQQTGGAATPAPDASTGDTPATQPVTTPQPVAVPCLPRSAIVTLPSLPATLAGLPAVGATQLSITLAQPGAQASSSVPVDVGARLTKGLPVKMTGPDGTTVSATVAAVVTPPPAAAAQGTGGADVPTANGGQVTPSDMTVQYAPDAGQAIPETWVGQQVVSVIQISDVADNALLVPTRAVALNSQGKGTVMVMNRDGSTTGVTVTELGELQGTSAIKPVNDGQLAVGDNVVVDSQ